MTEMKTEMERRRTGSKGRLASRTVSSIGKYEKKKGKHTCSWRSEVCQAGRSNFFESQNFVKRTSSPVEKLQNRMSKTWLIECSVFFFHACSNELVNLAVVNRIKEMPALVLTVMLNNFLTGGKKVMCASTWCLETHAVDLARTFQCDSLR